MITNVKNGKIYFGITQDPITRELQHRKKSNSTKLNEDIKLYGQDSIIFEIIKNFDNIENAVLAEKECVDYLLDNKYSLSYNTARAVSKKSKNKTYKSITVYYHPDTYDCIKYLMREEINNSIKEDRIPLSMSEFLEKLLIENIDYKLS